MPPASAENRTHRLLGLQALRGVAVLMVLAMHAINLTSVYSGLPFYAALRAVADFGHYGVDIFFVLSGVVIWLLLRPEATSIQSPGGFLIRRAAKLLPVFWCAVGAMLLLPAIPSYDNSPAELLANPATLVLLAPQRVHPPAWTLVYEAGFYIVAAVALLFGSRAWRVILAWIPVQIGLVALATLGLLPDMPLLRPVALELCAGLLVGWCATRHPMPFPRLALGLAFALIAAAAILLPIDSLAAHPVLRLPVLGLPAILIVYATVSLDMRAAVPPAPLVRLGEISYSVYMWHIPTLALLHLLLGQVLATPAGATLFLVSGATLSLALGWLGYVLIERPATRLGTRWTRRAEPPNTSVQLAAERG